MEPESLEVTRRIFAFCCLFFIAVNIVVLLPEVIRVIHLLLARYRHKKRHIKEILDNNTPPRATFFGRTDGKYTMIEGPYEDQYLSKWKRRLWRRNKKNRPQVVNKKSKMD